MFKGKEPSGTTEKARFEEEKSLHTAPQRGGIPAQHAIIPVDLMITWEL